MKRIATFALLLGGLMLAGCASSPAGISEDQYREFMSELPSYVGVEEVSLVKLGSGLCEMRAVGEETGTTQVEVDVQYLKIATDAGFDARDVGAFLVYATSAYCPEYSDADGLRSLLD